MFYFFRRANLRYCLEKLKDIVPLGSDSSRHTTLGLLMKAKSFIKTLEDKERKTSTVREQLKREQRFLQRRLDQLTNGQYRVRQERSISESSTATNSTSSSNSESDEIDIIGYGSGNSDIDDHSSIESGSSDGFTISAKRIRLNSSYSESI
ncbi:hypothetical protein DPMN_080540 [Dreissena polymorpha]|uniref:BHLH domain-containing protein n=1 Tax=Dreissena polymorpha TaxID=45954 RepID=A0A9D4BRZ7_DREPO|nr:hypothetical protein DPMN_080540 [Dreissena polymorpha]